MPRDSNGAYSLPTGTIVASGDVILPSQHNPAMNDIASSLTNSLTRTGAGGMLADLNLGGFSISNVLGASFGGDIVFPNTDTTEQRVKFTKAGRDTYLYANTTAIGVYDSVAGPIWAFTFADGTFKIQGQGVALLNGASFTAQISAPIIATNTAGAGRAFISAGTSTVSGYIAFQSPALGALGYVGQITSGGAINYVSQTGAGHAFTGGTVSSTGDISAPRMRSTLNDGSGQNIAVGDDTWIGDVNVASTMSVRGQSDPTSGFITFGSNSSRIGVNAGSGVGCFGGAFTVDAGQALAFGPSTFWIYSASKAVLYVNGNAVLSVDGAGNVRALGNITGNAGSL